MPFIINFMQFWAAVRSLSSLLQYNMDVPQYSSLWVLSMLYSQDPWLLQTLGKLCILIIVFQMCCKDFLLSFFQILKVFKIFLWFFFIWCVIVILLRFRSLFRTERCHNIQNIPSLCMNICVQMIFELGLVGKFCEFLYCG